MGELSEANVGLFSAEQLISIRDPATPSKNVSAWVSRVNEFLSTDSMDKDVSTEHASSGINWNSLNKTSVV